MTPDDCSLLAAAEAGPADLTARIVQVDAFTDGQRPFSGNPAAVVPLDAFPSDALMQAIAAENNLSETAFVVPDSGPEGEGDWRLRWFTPAVEVDLCGHATLAAGYVVMTRLQPGRRAVRFHTASGPLVVTRHGGKAVRDEEDDDTFTLDLPARPPGPALGDDARARIATAIGAPVEEAHDGRKWLAVVADEATVRGLVPDMAAIGALPSDGMIVTARGETADVVSRYFNPGAGVPEDPVTGSAHTVLTPFWAERLGRPRLVARQLSRRGGRLGCALENGRVHLTGRVVPYLDGRIRVPEEV